MNHLTYYLLDVFTDQIFGGNPLAVFPEADHLTDELMQNIARELNLSETTFIQAPKSSEADCTVRIFTPLRELPMAGHPTIGTAYTILKHQLLSPKNDKQLIFDLGVGPTAVDYRLSEQGPKDLFMYQPLPQFMETLDRVKMAASLSLSPDDIEEALPVQIVSCGVPLMLVPLKTLDAIQRTSLRMDMLEKAFSDVEPKEVFIFTMETELQESTVHCRMFGPRFGIPEDPATGGAHGPLGSYLVKYGLSDGTNIISEQGFEMKRPSRLQVRISTEDGKISQVLVGGDCVEIGQGRLISE